MSLFAAHTSKSDSGHRAHVRRLVKALGANDELVLMARARLVRDLTALRALQLQRTPKLSADISDVDVEKPEAERVYLPSGFSASARADKQLEALGVVELELRQGHAMDSLDTVRDAIRTLNLNKTVKRSDIHGTGANTKAQNYLKTLANDIQIAASAYIRDREALIALGTPETDPVFQPLLREQLHGKDGKAQMMGQMRTGDPWFWSTGRPVGLSAEQEKEWNHESKCCASHLAPA